jgi:hypothetical protein
MPIRKPTMRNLVFWGTAADGYVVPQQDWASAFEVKPTNTAAFNTQYPYSQYNINGAERKFYFVNNDSLNYVGFGVYKDSPPGSREVTTQGGLGKMLNNTWYRLVGIHKKGVEISLFINNQFAGSLPWTQGVETGDGPRPQQPWLGGISRGGINYDVNQFWRGCIGPACYFTRVWTPQEVAWDYNNGFGRRYSELGTAGTDGSNLLNDLVAWWQLTEEDTGLGPYIVRRDSHTGQHHLTRIIGQNPISVSGILPKTEPIADDDRVQELTDRSPQGNSIVQTDDALRPFWDARFEVVSIEPGAVFANTSFTGLTGHRLSLYLVSVVNESAENQPWLHLSDGGGANTGLKIYRENDTLKVKAWIGGSVRELSYALSYPAERLFEVHFNGARLSLWENGQRKATTVARGSFDDPLNRLELGPRQGLKELLIYNEAHK